MRAASRENFPHDATVDVGQPEIAALEAVGEPFVVDPQAVQDGGIQIVDVDGVPTTL